MKKIRCSIAGFIVKARFFLFTLFIIASAVSVWAMGHVNVNYDFTKYLPSDSVTAKSLAVMNEEFGDNGSARLMFTGVTEDEINKIYAEISDNENVMSVIFDSSDGNAFKDGMALFTVYFNDSDSSPSVQNTLSELKTEYEWADITISGGAAESAYIRTSLQKDLVIILIIALAIILFILLITSKSWADPLVFAMGIGVALLINMGTNALFTEISFVSVSICGVLQLALAMDYSIIILHRYGEEREKNSDRFEAMKDTIVACLPSVLSASLTTIAGLVAIMCMKFTIGLDIGAVLAKGIAISLIMSFFFLPAVMLFFDGLLMKTKHRSLLPEFKFTARFGYKARVAVPCFALILFIICGFLQSGMNFGYDVELPEDSEVYESKQKISENFDVLTPLVILIPNESRDKEKEIYDFVMSLEYDGKPIAAQGTSLAEKGVYDTIDIKTAAQTYGISEKYLAEVFDEVGDGGMATVRDILEYIAENDYINKVADRIQTKADELCSQMKSGERDMTVSEYLEECDIDENLPAVKLLMSLPGITAKTLAERITASRFIKSTVSELAEKADKLYNDLITAEKQLIGEHYTRLIFNLTVPAVGDGADYTVETLRANLDSICEGCHILGNSVNIYDIRNVFADDLFTVNFVSILSILIIVALSFRSVAIPVILVSAIEGAIFMNMTLEAFLGASVYFICYLIAICIQMGATIDYAILMTDRYREFRKTEERKCAIEHAVSVSLPAIITSGAIIVIAAAIVWIIASVPLISSIGQLISQGALMSLITVIFILPAFICLFDRFIIEKKK